MRRLGLLAAAGVLLTAPGAVAAPEVPAYGGITISDYGLGPHGYWTYDGVLRCGTTTEGLGGVTHTSVTVRCRVLDQGGLGAGLTCPLMVLSRSSLAPVGARATCSRQIGIGVGRGTETTQGDLGRVTTSIECAAYVTTGFLVPPYTVSCLEPGLPGGAA